MSGNGAPLTGPAPLLGQHKEEILTSVLGYTPEQVAQLKTEGTI